MSLSDNREKNKTYILYQLNFVSGHARQTRRFAIIIAALVWLLAIIVAIPAGLAYVRFFRVNRNMTFYVSLRNKPKFLKITSEIYRTKQNYM